MLATKRDTIVTRRKVRSKLKSRDGSETPYMLNRTELRLRAGKNPYTLVRFLWM